jgi:predicted GNAT family acetyltransferase
MKQELVNNEAQSRYELHQDGELAAQAVYRLHGDTVTFTHTEVSPQQEGQGLGSKLAGLALADVKQRGLKAVPQCSFIARYIEQHEEEFGELVQR